VHCYRPPPAGRRPTAGSQYLTVIENTANTVLICAHSDLRYNQMSRTCSVMVEINNQCVMLLQNPVHRMVFADMKDLPNVMKGCADIMENVVCSKRWFVANPVAMMLVRLFANPVFKLGRSEYDKSSRRALLDDFVFFEQSDVVMGLSPTVRLSALFDLTARGRLELRRRPGQLNLIENEIGSQEWLIPKVTAELGFNPECCICYEDLHTKKDFRRFRNCSHQVCCDCCQSLLDKKTGKLKCPMCRDWVSFPQHILSIRSHDNPSADVAPLTTKIEYIESLVAVPGICVGILCGMKVKRFVRLYLKKLLKSGRIRFVPTQHYRTSMMVKFDMVIVFDRMTQMASWMICEKTHKLVKTIVFQPSQDLRDLRKPHKRKNHVVA
jgi:hypothetical protein